MKSILIVLLYLYFWVLGTSLLVYGVCKVAYALRLQDIWVGQ